MRLSSVEAPGLGRLVGIALVLTACGDGGPLAPRGSLSLVAVSGDRQPGRAGHGLPEPLRVRVINRLGAGVGGVTVEWTVESGEGAFAGGVDVPGCPPLGTAVVKTGPDGFADASFTPTWFGSSTMAARVPGAAGSPVTFTTDASDPGATITIVDGNEQEGKAGEPLPRLLWVEVTDGEGSAVPHVSVRWTGDAAAGTLLEGCPWANNWNSTVTTTRTLPSGTLRDGEGSMGRAWVRFFPNAVGRSAVMADVAGLALSPTTFTVETTVMVIRLELSWGFGPRFVGPKTGPIQVPVGTPVELVNNLGPARIVSTSVPPGGEAFDSGPLDQGGRFSFVPGAAGNWEFVDQGSGTVGSVTAQ